MLLYVYDMQEPVVLTQTDLVSSALHWDLEYLEKHMGGAKHTVFVSKSKKFMYFDDKKVHVFNFCYTHCHCLS